MLRNGTSYNITATGIGGGAVDLGRPRAGFGFSIVPLHYTSAAGMLKLIAGLVADNDNVRVDPALNAIVVRGPAPRRGGGVR